MIATDPDLDARLRTLVREDCVHRDLYLDPALFALEQERLWARTWLYVGHESSVPAPGDFHATELAGRPVLMLRGQDGAVRVLPNRCAHKGAQLVTDPRGNVGKTLRCPYHGWSYRLDGALIATPGREGYAGSDFAQSDAAAGLRPCASAIHRGFVFARLSGRGPDFQAWAGPMLQVLDNMADRSPAGRLRVAGPPLRALVRCNWKVYLENVNDTVHALVTHASASGAAADVWSRQPTGTAKTIAIEQLLPFASDYDFFDRMGGRVHPGGHSILGTRHSIHSGYGALGEYEQSLAAAHGPQRAREVLAFSPQNSILYPSVAVKTSPLVVRVLRPLAVDRTLVEAWALVPEDAPALLAERALSYVRLVFSPMSIVAHDDLHVWESIQRALAHDANPWVSLHRGWKAPEMPLARTPGRTPELAPEVTPEVTPHATAGDGAPTAPDARAPGGQADVSGTDERLMRNQHHAWLRAMTAA